MKETIDDRRYRMQQEELARRAKLEAEAQARNDANNMALESGDVSSKVEAELTRSQAEKDMDDSMLKAVPLNKGGKLNDPMKVKYNVGGSMLSSPEREEYNGGGIIKLIVAAVKKSKSVKKGKPPKRAEIQTAINDVKDNNFDKLNQLLKNNKSEQRDLSKFENYATGGGGKGDLDAFVTSVLKPATENQERTKSLIRATKTSRDDKAVTGVAGLGAGTLLGGAGTLAVMSDSEEERINPEDYPTYKKDSDSGKAFREAQREAKKEKAEFFEFEGREYNVREAKNVGGKLKYAEGSMLVPPEMEGDMPEDTYDNIPEDEKEAAEASQLPDDEMEEDYTSYVLEESLDMEEQEYLMGVLENDERLSGIFDKVMDIAGEFSGEGEVSGLGTGVSDSIPARLSDGEFVFTKKATDQMGADQLQTMMDEAEKAYDGGLMKKAFGGMVDDTPEMEESKEDEEINSMMIASNQMPSVRPR